MVKKNNAEDISIQDLQKQITKLNLVVNKIEIEIKKNNVNKKKLKDPNMPKKPMTPFIFFNKENIDEYKRKNPNEKVYVTKIVKKSGEDWKKLKENEKEKYIKMSDKDKKRYEKEIIKYNKEKDIKNI
jgi:high mobility group protein B3